MLSYFKTAKASDDRNYVQTITLKQPLAVPDKVTGSKY